MSFAEELLTFLDALEPLADLPRTGWVLRGVVPCESIADHTLGVAFVTLKLVDRARDEGLAVDGERALRMALLHDAPEARTGDVPQPVKSAALDAALKDVERTVAVSVLGKDAALIEEYDAKRTLEAKLVRAADKIQMLARARSYQRKRGASLEEFFETPPSMPEGTPLFVLEVLDALRA